MKLVFSVSDLHGKPEKCNKLFSKILDEKPLACFIGGDLFPFSLVPLQTKNQVIHEFLEDFLVPNLLNIKEKLNELYPEVYLILGNDDPAIEEDFIKNLGENHKVWKYIHNQTDAFREFEVFGYNCVPPTSFMLKDWERFDISRFGEDEVISKKGYRTKETSFNEIEFSSIKEDLHGLSLNKSMDKAIYLFHAPPYETKLDFAYDKSEVQPVDYPSVNIGSKAIKNFIVEKQPLITLHGHAYQSTRISGVWYEQIGRTHCFQSAHDGKELCLVKIDLENPSNSVRELL